MSSRFGIALATLVLSLLVWTVFYIMTPDAPLGPQETSVVVGVCLGLVIFGKWVWTLQRKRRTGK